MTQWLLQTLGLGDDIALNLDRAVLGFHHPAWLWMGGVLVIPLSVWLYRRQQRNLGSISTRLSILLTVLRGAILAALFIVLAGPTLKIDCQRETRPVVALLFDHSASMDVPAGPFEDEARLVALAAAAGYPATDDTIDPETRQALNRISRMELARSVIGARTNAFLNGLADRFDLRHYTFADELVPLTPSAVGHVLPDISPHAGSATHIGSAVSELLDDMGARDVAGVVLVSDGRNTGGLSPAEAAGRASALGAPVYALVTESAPTLKDASIVDVGTSGVVTLGDTASVSVSIESEGLDGKRVNVELLDGEKVLDAKELTLNQQERQHVSLSFETTEAGSRILTIRLPPLEGEPESLHANNQDYAVVNVSRDTLRVLYLDGLPRWDFRYLKNAMRRDRGLAGRTESTPDIVLEAEQRRQAAGGAPSPIPDGVEALADYHTVVLGDVSPYLADASFQAHVAEAVQDKGVGLIVMAGPWHMPHALGESFRDLLPVRMVPSAAGLDAPVYRPFRLELTPEGMEHSVTRLYEETARNQFVWSAFPEFYWCSAVDRPAPGATVLVANRAVGGKQGSLPLVAYHYAGNGKVLFVGTDATWLWRRHAADRFFQRFWGQAIRFVARRDASRNVSTLHVAPQRVAPGQAVALELYAFGAGGKPVGKRTLHVQVGSGATTDTIDLAADPDRKGRYTGLYTADATGVFRAAYDPGPDAETVVADFLVTPSSLEHRNLRVNQAELEAVASTSGGRTVPLTELDGLADELAGEATRLRVHHEASIWDNWLTVVLVVALYGLDVGLRRLTGLP